MIGVLAICLYALAGSLALAFPLVAILFGMVFGIRGERRKVVAYLRSLDEMVPPSYLATRIEGRAHRGFDVSSMDEVIEEQVRKRRL